MAKPVVLCILDGWGLREAAEGNAPLHARTPTVDRVFRDCPRAKLLTHGLDVGLPLGQMGNSEVGHTNIGAGRIVDTDLVRIDRAISDGSFATHPELLGFARQVKEAGGRAHLLGLVSDGGVHAHLNHMIAAARALDAAGVPVVIHALTDGRDVAPRSALGYFEMLAQGLPPTAQVATVTGRYYALDRDNRWPRVARAYHAITMGEGHRADTAQAAVARAYEQGQDDEFIDPAVLGDYAGARHGDGLFCLNFRADRAREIMLALGDPAFSAFDRREKVRWAALLGMSPYSSHHETFMRSVYGKSELKNTLGAWVAAQGKRQFRLAETEKYPHVTFFFNGGQEEPAHGEDRVMPASPDVATYDLQPEMAAAEVTSALVGAIETGYDLIVVNYANPDMVGHTGSLSAAIAACEAVDAGLKQVLNALEVAGGVMLLTADHGNCELMIDPATGGPHTAHTLNPVPMAVIGASNAISLRDGRLADVAPTVLKLMGLPQPKEMTGICLIR
ncbi:MAG: 2,3-bisphosphoglycerate-independent phosphoglycerate mutase [Pseudomonadota bacterium]